MPLRARTVSQPFPGLFLRPNVDYQCISPLGHTIRPITDGHQVLRLDIHAPRKRRPVAAIHGHRDYIQTIFGPNGDLYTTDVTYNPAQTITTRRYAVDDDFERVDAKVPPQTSPMTFLDNGHWYGRTLDGLRWRAAIFNSSGQRVHDMGTLDIGAPFDATTDGVHTLFVLAGDSVYADNVQQCDTTHPIAIWETEVDAEIYSDLVYDQRSNTLALTNASTVIDAQDGRLLTTGHTQMHRVLQAPGRGIVVKKRCRTGVWELFNPRQLLPQSTQSSDRKFTVCARLPPSSPLASPLASPPVAAIDD